MNLKTGSSQIIKKKFKTFKSNENTQTYGHNEDVSKGKSTALNAYIENKIGRPY